MFCIKLKQDVVWHQLTEIKQLKDNYWGFSSVVQIDCYSRSEMVLVLMSSRPRWCCPTQWRTSASWAHGAAARAFWPIVWQLFSATKLNRFSFTKTWRPGTFCSSGRPCRTETLSGGTWNLQIVSIFGQFCTFKAYFALSSIAREISNAAHHWAGPSLGLIPNHTEREDSNSRPLDKGTWAQPLSSAVILCPSS